MEFGFQFWNLVLLTKDHFREMLVRAVSDKALKARTVLFDSWYALVENLKLLMRLNLTFITTLKNNRLVMVWDEKAGDKATKTKSQWVYLEAPHVSAAKPVRKETISPVATWRGLHSNNAPVQSK